MFVLNVLQEVSIFKLVCSVYVYCKVEVILLVMLSSSVLLGHHWLEVQGCL